MDLINYISHLSGLGTVTVVILIAFSVLVTVLTLILVFAKEDWHHGTRGLALYMAIAAWVWLTIFVAARVAS